MQKPRDYQVVSTDFRTDAQRDAAEAIQEHYGDGEGKTKSIQEIAERTEWSRTHIANVLNEFFEPVDDEQETLVDVTSVEDIEDNPDERFEEGFIRGFKLAMDLANTPVSNVSLKR